MNRNIFSRIGVLALVIFITSCGVKESGQLTGVTDRPSWTGINPYGMIYVASGTLHIGQSDQDVFSTYIQKPRSVSVQGFYMDDTEITNNEYRQFVYWVRDSIAHSIMGDYIEDDFGNERIALAWACNAPGSGGPGRCCFHTSAKPSRRPNSAEMRLSLARLRTR